MNLFPYEPTRNLLPFDGIVNYYGPILAPCEAQDYLEVLLTTVPWRNDEAVICGKRIVTARKVAWYGDSSFSYTPCGFALGRKTTRGFLFQEFPGSS
jgi:hypothetical protein